MNAGESSGALFWFFRPVCVHVAQSCLDATAILSSFRTEHCHENLTRAGAINNAHENLCKLTREDRRAWKSQKIDVVNSPVSCVPSPKPNHHGGKRNWKAPPV